jgi:hypothetical protein
MGIRAQNKFGNTPTLYKGRRFASQLEASHAAELDMLRRAKDPSQQVKSVEYQYRIPIVMNGIKCGTYVADFYVLFADGHKEIQETKGFKTQLYNLKKKLVEAQYGEKIIEF